MNEELEDNVKVPPTETRRVSPAPAQGGATDTRSLDGKSSGSATRRETAGASGVEAGDGDAGASELREAAAATNRKATDRRCPTERCRQARRVPRDAAQVGRATGRWKGSRGRASLAFGNCTRRP